MTPAEEFEELGERADPSVRGGLRCGYCGRRGHRRDRCHYRHLDGEALRRESSAWAQWCMRLDVARRGLAPEPDPAQAPEFRTLH